MKPKRVKFRASFGFENRAIGIINRFRYKLAIFELEGKFLGWQDLSDQLLLCRTSTELQEELLTFGTTLSSSCNFDLSKLVSSSIFDHHKSQDLFFELYLEDYNEDLIDIPVLIKNFKDFNGVLRNADSSSGKESGWRLVRRFFLVDTKSGISGADGYVNGI